MGPYPDATPVFDIDAIGLTNMVNLMNHGLDLGGNSSGEPTSFTIGVGVNPAIAISMTMRTASESVVAIRKLSLRSAAESQAVE